MNRVILLGNLGKDPELRHTKNGKAVCNFSMATSEKWTDEGGEKREQTEWHRIIVWGKQAEACSMFLHKGSKVMVEGKLTTRKWQNKQGVDQYTTEVVAAAVEFVSSKREGGGAQANEPPPPEDDGNVPF